MHSSSHVLETKTLYKFHSWLNHSVTNILFSCVWIAAIIGVFAILKKKKQSLEAFDKSEGV